MKIFNATQIKKWEEYTILNEPLPAIDLMERAAIVCCKWMLENKVSANTILIFCGTGNNGADGLAIGRILIRAGWQVSIFILPDISRSDLFRINLEKVEAISNVRLLSVVEDCPEVKPGDIIVEALFGTGINRNLQGIAKDVTCFINRQANPVISVDIPSGLFPDSVSDGEVIRATYTLTFQTTKLCFLVAENQQYFGKVNVLPIGLHPQFANMQDPVYELLDPIMIKNIFKPRQTFSHKGDFGYACIIAGSYGMMGAAVLATKACLRTGAGKVCCLTAGTGYQIMQQSAPEALTLTSGRKFIKKVPDLAQYNAIGIGPGLGTHETTKELLLEVFENFRKPLVIDADALNVISSNIYLLGHIPRNSILTPHPKEFDRLFGKSLNDFERIKRATDKAKELNIYIVLKGHFTLIATPSQRGYFNSTGNPGMATGGSGDVLTGIITGLMAQHYSAFESCILGVYLHGLTGDIAANKICGEGLIASDFIENLGAGFQALH